MQEQARPELNAGVDALWIHISTTDKKGKSSTEPQKIFI
jgi:hypothetical protein